MPDTTDDEARCQDETWCLYGRPAIDDELSFRLTGFGAACAAGAVDSSTASP